MNNHFTGFMFFGLALMTACGTPSTGAQPHQTDTLRYDAESHLRNVRQLTFGGDNAEAYWSFDGEKLVFQANNLPAWGTGCDQIFWMDLEADATEKAEGLNQISNGQGRTTCAYFLPGDTTVVFASTLGGHPVS